MNADKRSSKRNPDHPHAGQPGVGGRQGSSAPSREGGEYQNSCDFSELPESATTIADLKKMGLPPLWVAAAERIGVDAFLELWALLDAGLSIDDRRVWVPQMAVFQRFHRNRLIRSLERDGMSSSEIVTYLREHLSIGTTYFSVRRACEKGRNLSESVDRPAG